MKERVTKSVYAFFMVCAMLFVFSFSFNQVAHAKSITLTNWHSNGSTVGYWRSNPKVSFKNLNSSFEISKYLSNAVTAWKDGGKGISSVVTVVPADASIKYYSGTRAELNGIGFSYSATDHGCTKYFSRKKAADANNLTVVMEYFDVSASTQINAPNEQNTTTHEYGHALGWEGHSYTSTDVMCAHTHAGTKLSTKEKNHLIEVYKKMR